MHSPGHQRKGWRGRSCSKAFTGCAPSVPSDATVDTGDAVPANAFYTAMGFTEAYKSMAWRKEW